MIVYVLGCGDVCVWGGGGGGVVLELCGFGWGREVAAEFEHPNGSEKRSGEHISIKLIRGIRHICGNAVYNDEKKRRNNTDDDNDDESDDADEAHQSDVAFKCCKTERVNARC